MTRARRVALAFLIALSALWAGGATVDAHALLVSSTPAANAVLATAPTSVSLTFSEPPDPRLSSVKVLDVSGTDHATGPATQSGANGATLTAPLGTLPDGVYTVAWRTVSSSDGHTAAGSFAFSVGTGTAPPAGTGSGGTTAGASAVSPASVFARVVWYLGMVVLLGSLITGEALLGDRARRLGRIRLGAWAAAVVGAVMIFATEASDAGVSVADALGSSLATDFVLRLVPLLAAGVAMLVAARSVRWHRPAWAIAAVSAAVALLADAAASHAATVVAPPLNIALQWLHAVGVSVWLGGLAGLLLELRDPDLEGRARLVLRFSRWATFGILIVATTGVARAAFELHNLGELISTDYGRLLLAKAALFGGLALLGAVNHFRNVPEGDAGLHSVRRVGSLELVLGTTAIVVASLLVTTPPPADAGTSTPGSAAPGPNSPTPGGITVTGSDYGSTVRVSLTVTPSTPGPAAFRAVVADYDTGTDLAVSGVTLRFALPSRPDVGESSLALAAAPDGAYTGSGSNLSLAGIWVVTATVSSATASVEVPLAVPMAPSPSSVDVNRATGQPTLYTAHLAGGVQVQLYLDPFGPGLSTLHITYFDAAGKELPVSGIRVEASQGGGPPTLPPMSPIEPGHATARLQTTVGVPIAMVITGTAPDGVTSFALTIIPDQ